MLPAPPPARPRCSGGWAWRGWARWLALVVWASATVRAADPAVGEGEPFLQHFSPRDYHAETGCWCGVQDGRRIMYVGNVGVVLEYDGTSWRKVPALPGQLITALAVDPASDTLFAGALGGLGYLPLLPDGTREYVSLLDRLPPAARDVGLVSGVYPAPGGAFFVGAAQVMRWRDGRFQVWPLEPEGKLTSAWADGHLYVHNPRLGLLRLEGDAFVPVSSDPLLRRVSVRAVLPLADDTLLVGTYHDGAYVLRRDGSLVPWPSPCNAFLKSWGLYRMQRLRDGSFAVATDTAGLLLLDREGGFRHRVDGSGGLHGSNLLNLYQDAEDGLWLCLQSGCTRAEVSSPLSVLRAGPEDSLAITVGMGSWFGSAVLGNSNGLYQVVPADPQRGQGPHLRRLPDITDSFSSVCGVSGGLLTIASGRIALLDAGARLVPVAGEITVASHLLASRAVPGRVYVTDEGGHVTTLRLDPASGRWGVDRVVVSLGRTGEMFIAESANGDLWLGTRDRGLFRAHAEPGGAMGVTAFFEQPGPLHGQGFVRPNSEGEPLSFHTRTRLYRPDATGGRVLPEGAYGPSVSDGALVYQLVTQLDARSLWIIGDVVGDPAAETVLGRALAGGPDHPPAFQPLPRQVQDGLGAVDVLMSADPAGASPDVVLIGGALGNSLVRLDVSRWAQRSLPPLRTMIRRARVAGSPRDGQRPPPVLRAPLTYQQNSVHFEYAADTLALGAAPRFQTRLVDGGSDEWSDFTDRHETDYLNLSEGRYTFEVRARDADGRLGSVASLPFRILPPWQRTPWAYAGYALASALALWGLVRWRGRQLRRRNAVLAALVDARTGELRGREAELVRARDDAEAANRAKSAFLANMSHELRTPLNAILGYTQILLKHAELPSRSREQVAVIGQSGNHLLSLINEVLDLSKIEAGKLTLVPHDFSLRALLDEVGAAFRPRFAEKGLAFVERRSPHLPEAVHTDSSRLRQILFNLLSNAAKFTDTGSVTLTVEPVGEGRVRFEVSDTGEGIAPGDLTQIFRAFYQAGDRRLAAQGTGLGLAISQRLVGLLGGRIEVVSTPGQGSRFWFDLPLRPTGPADRSVHHGHQPSSSGRVTGYAGAPRRLLLVDDVAENRRVLRGLLQPLGFEIEEAADGGGGLAACERHPPDAVLLDLRLGAMDGFEVARALRTRSPQAPLGIVAISASVFESDRQRALDAGCDDFLPKPFEEAQLLAVLGRVLGLDWITADASSPSISPGLPTGDQETSLPPGQLAVLLELSLRGDIAGLRGRLDALHQAGPTDGAAAQLLRLETLAAAYDMDGLHALLLKLHAHVPG